MVREGNTAFMAGDFALAARRWESVAARLLPKRERSLLRLAVLARSRAAADQERLLRVTASLAADEPATALPLYTRLAEAAGDTGERAALARCRLLITLDQPASAESALEAFIKRYPGDAGAWLELGRLQAFTLNKVADGAGALETAARSSSPIGVEARYLLCGVLVKQGKWKDAVNALEKFQADFPDSRFAAAADMSLKTCRERITKAAPAAGSQEALAVKEKLSHQQALQKAEQAYDGKGYEDAYKRYTAMLRDPDFKNERPLCSLRLALCQLAMGREKEGLTGLDQTARLYPDSQEAGEALFTAATFYLENYQDFNSAASRCQRLVDKYPEHPLRKEAELMLVKTLICKDRLQAAEILLERLDKETPQPANAPPDEIRRLLAVCRGDSPVRDGLTLVREPANQAQLRLADTRFAAREYAKAAKLYNDCARRMPGTDGAAYASLQRARCLNQMGEYKDALSLYKQFTKRYRNSQLAPQALLRAGVMQVGPLHNQSAGEKIFKIIVDRYPNAPAAQTAAVYLATLTLWDGDYKQALEEYEAYLKRWPDGEHTLYVKKHIESIREKI
ncbi:MAG: tetratricopeptide repeat protein [Lentisphaeria bacterium]|nr:tetratricopeptide repeat protein [Lentisphaeria bacterium]